MWWTSPGEVVGMGIRGAERCGRARGHGLERAGLEDEKRVGVLFLLPLFG